MKILTVVGARPQFIKAATVSRALAASERLFEVIVHTGQHYDANMSDIFFKQLDIPAPDYQLGVGGGSHGAMTGRQLEKIEEVLVIEKPDLVLVYGDTNSTLAGALAAVKLHIPVAHVEAGLRSFNRRMPEEINRVLTDHVSSLLFAPTSHAQANLRAEGIAVETVHVVGDVMYDAALFFRARAKKPAWFDSLGVREGEFALCTVHRAENTDDPAKMSQILAGLTNSGIPTVLPLHPRTRARLLDMETSTFANIHFTDPVGYLEMTWLEMNCKIVATDSGGIQKEAFFHGKPCITLRQETEWMELVEHGANELVGCCADAISSALTARKFPSAEVTLYGHGDSATQIRDVILRS